MRIKIYYVLHVNISKKCLQTKIFLESNSKSVKLHVPNVFVTKDIINKFYQKETNTGNYPEWLRVLTLYYCSKYLLVPFDHSLLENLKVDSEGFEMLISVLQDIRLSSKYLKLLVENIPNDYDLSNLDKNIKEMIKYYYKYDILFCSDDNISIWNINTNKLIKQVSRTTISSNGWYNYRVLLIKNYLIIMNRNIEIWNIYDLTITNKFNHVDSNYIINIGYNKINNTIVFINTSGEIITYDFDTEIKIKIININLVTKYIDRCFMSDDCKYLTITKSNHTYFIEIETGKIKGYWNRVEYKKNPYISKIIFSPNNKYFACIYGDHDVEIYAFDSNTLIYSTHAVELCFSCDDRYLYYSTQTEFEVYDLSIGKLIKIIDEVGETYGNFPLSLSCSNNKQFAFLNSIRQIKIYDTHNYDTLSNIIVCPDNKHFPFQSKIFFIEKNNDDLYNKINKL
uniref:Putative BTB_POZ domain and WD-repeat protein n=1 Tax=Moumouvirus sp. 'Monve' TaxID=1128131 RepID=H2ECZ1_9VIRU|nr:putative BTB_POZ domain and WD-repeat protein [Moumouvirus Monve]